jgi:hypothetical protein
MPPLPPRRPHQVAPEELPESRVLLISQLSLVLPRSTAANVQMVRAAAEVARYRSRVQGHEAAGNRAQVGALNFRGFSMEWTTCVFVSILLRRCASFLVVRRFQPSLKVSNQVPSPPSDVLIQHTLSTYVDHVPRSRLSETRLYLNG